MAGGVRTAGEGRVQIAAAALWLKARHVQMVRDFQLFDRDGDGLPEHDGDHQ